MSNNYFRFKQFTVWQEKTAMKVGTDGVLLGVLAHCASTPKRVLDIGTGTGLVALIVAQRFTEALVDAVEIDAQASVQATENVAASPFADRINVINTDICAFRPPTKYDLIVCNPPYFVNSLLNPDPQRAQARHTIALTFSQLACSAAKLLNPIGEFAVVLPADMLGEFVKCCLSEDLHMVSQVSIKTTPRKPSKRVVAHFSFDKNKKTEVETLVIESSPMVYTPEFDNLIHDFYLDRQ